MVSLILQASHLFASFITFRKTVYKLQLVTFLFSMIHQSSSISSSGSLLQFFGSNTVLEKSTTMSVTVLGKYMDSCEIGTLWLTNTAEQCHWYSWLWREYFQASLSFQSLNGTRNECKSVTLLLSTSSTTMVGWPKLDGRNVSADIFKEEERKFTVDP